MRVIIGSHFPEENPKDPNREFISADDERYDIFFPGNAGQGDKIFILKDKQGKALVEYSYLTEINQ